MTNRMEKIDELIKQEVSRELLRLFPDMFISITFVEVSKDLAYAKIWITSLVDVDYALKEINKSKHEMQKSLLRLPLRQHPKLRFVPDMREIKAQKIDTLIEQIKEDK